MSAKLPSLNALRFFECAARHASFTKAAVELCVTQGAVSRQIKSLESELGYKLFQRRGPYLALTTHGEKLLVTVSTALTTLSKGLEAISQQDSTSLSISVLPSFASHWLVPRLDSFEEAHRELTVRLSSSYAYVDFSARTDIDAAIRMGSGDWPHCHVEQLTRDVMLPVCSPGLAREIKNLDDLRAQTLLVDIAPHDEWKRWFAQQDCPYEVARRKIYDDVGAQIMGAIEGRGVSLLREELIRNDLREKRLVTLFDTHYKSELHFYFVCPPEKMALPKLRSFRDWLFEQMAAVE